VRLWRLPAGDSLGVLEGHTDSISNLAISPVPLAASPEEWLLASGSRDGTLRLWRLPGETSLPPGQGAALATLEGHTGPILGLAISPDGQLLASASRDRTLRLWRLPDGEAIKALKGHTDPVLDVAISQDGRLLASGSSDNTIRLWRLPDGEALGTLEGHTDNLRCLAISHSPPGSGRRQVLVSGAGGLISGTVRLWKIGPLLLSGLAVQQTRPEDIEWAQEALEGDGLTDQERVLLEYVATLMRWRRRFDILVGAAPVKIPAGEFDIEVEG
jgi:WD40 repeat protein